MSGNVHEATLVRTAELAQAVYEYVLRLDPPEPFHFRPGQFISLRVGQDGEGNAVLRSYSLGSSPGVAELTLILKHIDGGAASEWFRALRPGDRMRFTGPMGFFVLDLMHGGDIVFGATGVGVTPVLPMLREVLGRAETGRVRLYWGNRSPADLFWQEELDALARAHRRFELRRFVSRPNERWEGPRGRITSAILADVPALVRPTFYLVGNGAMIREVKAALVEAGVDRKRQIRNEAFFQ